MTGDLSFLVSIRALDHQSVLQCSVGFGLAFPVLGNLPSFSAGVNSKGGTSKQQALHFCSSSAKEFKYSAHPVNLSCASNVGIVDHAIDCASSTLNLGSD
ncbi:hypothetical protein TWF970_004454 [Orbilia oligospora]|uniref:Uncharacterized protein n=1 Tax=Orbilia oligospora TaxID=2813651 RepID=A0A7C8RAR2_ORBOL|nr:hypothetical protein TWF970_004454 [Orbilia oligospora]